MIKIHVRETVEVMYKSFVIMTDYGNIYISRSIGYARD